MIEQMTCDPSFVPGSHYKPFLRVVNADRSLTSNSLGLMPDKISKDDKILKE